MKRYWSAALVVVAAVVAATTAHAQGSAEFGAGIGYEFGVPLGLNRLPGAINTNPGFDGKGESYNHIFSLGAWLAWPRLFSTSFGLRLSFDLASSVGQFRSDPYKSEAIIDTSGALRTLSRRFTVDPTESMLRFGIGTRYTLGSLLIEPGLWSSIRMASNVTWVEEDADTIPSIEGTTSVAIDDRFLSDPFRYGLSLAGSIRIPLSPGLALQPSIYSRFDILAALRDGQGLRSFSGGLGFAVAFDATAAARGGVVEEPAPVAAADTPSRNPAPVLAPSVQLYSGRDGGRDTNSVVIRVEDVVHRLRMPLLPLIFFDRDASSLPARYTRLQRSEAGTFSLASLAGSTPLAVYHSTLNIVGWRLRREPSAHITITGSVSSDEKPQLAGLRAQSVAAYLRDVWDIDEERIEVREKIHTGSGNAERQVELSATVASILAPVGTQWIARDLVMPAIGAVPMISPESAVGSWTITITQQGRQVARYSDRDSGKPEEQGIILPVPTFRDTPPPLVATLVVIDAAGRRSVAMDTLPILWDSVALQPEGVTKSGRERLRVLLPGNEREDAIPAANDMLFQSLTANVRTGARVRISPLAGDGARGVSTVAARADATGLVARDLLAELNSRGIRLSGLQIEPMPSAESWGASNAPEKSFFSAGTEIVVEQEVDGGGASSP
jgi:hypothetical protein